MRMPSAELVRRALSGHAAIGLLVGALLYLVCLSGTLIVVHEEWQRWEQPNVAEARSIAPDAVQRAIARVRADERGKPPTSHLYVHLPNDALPRTVITTDHGATYVDGSGNPIEPEAHHWTEFLIGLHYYLHMPALLGMTIVGVLGVMMSALIIGGVLAHPRIFRDAFRLRGRGDGQIALADWHNRLGVWTLPFGLAVAVTGALIGLASLVAFATAATWYGGDTQKVFAPVFGGEPEARASTRLPDVAAALRDMEARFPGVTPTYVILHDPGTPKQHVQIVGEHPRRLIFGEYYRYDEAGRFRGINHLSDGEWGQQLAASTYRLHFGNFAGLPVKLAYMAFGLATVVVSATGTWLWLGKRRQRGRAAPRLEAMWAALVWGAPALIAAAILIRWAGGSQALLTGVFWIGLALLLAAACATANGRLVSRGLRIGLALLLAAVAVCHVSMLREAFAPYLITDAAIAVVAGLVLPPSRLRRDRGRRLAALAG